MDVALDSIINVSQNTSYFYFCIEYLQEMVSITMNSEVSFVKMGHFQSSIPS